MKLLQPGPVADAAVLYRVELNSIEYREHKEDCSSLQLNFAHGISMTIEGARREDVARWEPGAEYAISVRQKSRGDYSA